MASRTYTIKKRWQGIYIQYLLIEAEVSQNDTITLNEFSSAVNLSNAYFMKHSDASEMTNTHAALNVVTITGAGTNIRCAALIAGVKAT